MRVNEPLRAPRDPAGDATAGPDHTTQTVISAKVYVEHDKIALAPTIRSLPDANVSVVSEAGTDPVHEVYFYRFEASDFEEVESVLDDDDTVADYTPIVDTGNRRTYRVEYSDDAKLVTPMVSEVGGLTLSSERHANGWVLELQLRDRDGLYELSESADESGIHLEILGIHDTEGTYDREDFGLTESQQEALLAGFVNGYYDDPRETSLVDLAELLDISPTALSGRLRRGSARLIEQVLIEDDRE